MRWHLTLALRQPNPYRMRPTLTLPLLYGEPHRCRLSSPSNVRRSTSATPIDDTTNPSLRLRHSDSANRQFQSDTAPQPRQGTKTHPAQSLAHPFPLLHTSQLPGADVHPGIPSTAQALEFASGLQNPHWAGLPVHVGAVSGVW